MGTNYYWHEKPPCTACGHAAEPIHIGKSSSGWVFALHVYPESGINDLPDWIGRFYKSRIITDEYGKTVTPGEMLETIMLRGRENPSNSDLNLNQASRGPRNLLRANSSTDGVRWGAGTWDCHVREFS